MFPSVRVNLSGLEEEASYCLMLEMVPIGDCRYKFSGSQWVPAGGAEPQSPQRMYLHPDSPALGSHWNSQPVSFSKVKLTNNTLDSNGHVSTTSDCLSVIPLLSHLKSFRRQWNLFGRPCPSVCPPRAAVATVDDI